MLSNSSFFSSSSTTEPIAAPPLSVAPAEGPELVRKRRRLAKAFPSSATAAAAPTPSTEEESFGSPLVNRKRKLPEVGGASSLQPGEIEVVEIEEGSASPPSTQPAPAPTGVECVTKGLVKLTPLVLFSP